MIFSSYRGCGKSLGLLEPQEDFDFILPETAQMKENN